MMGKCTLKFILALIIAFSSLPAIAKLLIPSDATKVALIIGAPIDRKGSKSGHSMLRFSKKESFDTFNDVVVEFAADVKGKPSSLKGIGLGEKYPLIIKSFTYAQSYTKHTKEWERNLTHYELNLTANQVNELVNLINGHITNNVAQKYHYIFNNCNSAINRLIEKVTGLNFYGLKQHIPVQYPKVLKKHNLIKREFVVYSNLYLRKQVIEKKFEALFSKQNNVLTKNLKNQLLSPIFLNRLIGYAKIDHFLRNTNDQNFKKSLTRFSRQLIINELPQKKNDLLNLILKRKNAIKITYLPFISSYKKYSLTGALLQLAKSNKLEGNIALSKNAPIITLKGSYKRQVNKTKIKRHYKLHYSSPKLTKTNDSNIIWTKEAPLTIMNTNNVVSQNINNKFLVSYELIRENDEVYILPFIIADQLLAKKNKYTGLDFINIADEKNPAGICLGMNFVQKRLMENVTFMPELPRKSILSIKGLILKSMQDKKVVIGGIHNIKELTHVVGETFLREVSSNKNNEYNNFINLSKLWFQKVNVTSKRRINELQESLSIGIFPIAFFRPSKEIRAEHSILIYGISEKEDRYELHIYDPNLGMISKNYKIKLWINKNNFTLGSNYYQLPQGVKLNIK